MFRRTMIFGSMFICLVAAAQDASSLKGDWLVKFNGANGIAREAKLTIDGDNGSYQNAFKVSGGDPCLPIKAPTSVSDVSSEGFQLNILGSKSMTGCADWHLIAKRVDDKTYESQWPDGRKVQLLKQ